jgi:hypothetical protein
MNIPHAMVELRDLQFLNRKPGALSLLPVEHVRGILPLCLGSEGAPGIR